MARIFREGKALAGAAVKKFLRLFKDYRGLEKSLGHDEAVIASMARYIEALEGRDRERAARIAELEAAIREARDAARELRARLAALCANRKKEEP
jgi:septal ring factor EnvC (AmiA/AmiB activator)